VGLDREKLVAILTNTTVLPASGSLSVHLFETIPSTNQKLWQLLEQGAKPGTVVIANQQTAGRGQWGRQWSSPAGGLYLSVALAPNLPALQSYQLTLCSAWGIAMALRDRGIPVGLKWPNDLLLQERKLGGILTETKVRQGKITRAVVGVGINWANPVPTTGINLQSFQAEQASSPITCLEMLAAIALWGIAFGYELCSPAGINILLPSYNKLLTSIGKIVSVNGRSGIVVGINPMGELRVRLAEAAGSNSSNASEIYLQPGTIRLGYDD
jgi:BirA family biotin operon repressor/biotin-[acetyl-CoA-carboxylase] ligase